MIKHFLLVAALLFCFESKAYSQSQKADSLQTVFESPIADTVRLLACKRLTTALASIDSAKAEAFILKGIALSEQLSDPEARLFFESQRARILLDRNLYDEAIALCEQILSQAENKNYASVKGNCNEILGNTYLQKSNYIKVKYYLEKSLAYHENKNDPEKIASLLSALGIAYEQLGNLKEALVYLNKSLSIAKDLGDEQATALNIRYLGAVYSTQGLFEKALKYYDESLEIERKTNNEHGIASCLFEISTTYGRLGKYKEANSYCEKAIKIFSKTGDIREVILLTTHIGINYIKIGRYDQAIAYLNEAAKQAEINNLQYLMSGIYMHLAIVHIEQGNFNKGVQHFSYSLDLEKETGNKSKIVTILNNLGYTYQLMGDYDKSLSFYKKSLTYNDSSQILIRAKTMGGIGFCYLQNLHNEDSAFHYFDKANEIYRNMGSKRPLRQNLETVGNWYTSQGQIPKALKFYSAALKIVEEAEDSLGIANIYSDLASVYENQQNWDEAIAYHKKALRIYDLTDDISASSKTKIALAELYVDKSDYQQAINLANQAQKNFQHLQDSCQFSNSNLVLGRAFSSLQQRDSAIYYLNKSSIQAQKCMYYVTAAQANLELGKIYTVNDQSAKAFNAYREALKYAESSQDRRTIQEAAAYLFPVYQQKGQYKKAFETINLYQANKDSLFNQENTRNLVQKEMEYAYAKAEQENALAKQEEDALVQRTYERQRWIIYTSVGGFLAMILIALVIYRNYRNKQQLIVLLRKQKEELEELDHVKSRLFANLSHELRTPLTLISSPIQSLINDRETHTQATMEKLELVNRNSQQLRGLVDDIMDLSKLESNKMEVHEESVAIAPLLRRIFSNFSSLAEHLSIKYTIQLEELADEWVLLDAVKVEKILNNLLSNAIKHTPSGGEVTLSAHQADEKLLLHVVDTGQGIAAADLPLIFDRFYQSTQPDAPIQGGTGIGLALAKELTSLMNGRLSVESELGKGSQFSLGLPYEAADPPMLIELPFEDVHEEVSLAHLAQTNIAESERLFNVLIVEDHPDMQLFVKGLLGMKYHIHLASNGKEALKVLTKGRIDLIVSDVMMPEMNGYELLKHLKDSDDFRNIPVIMLTALDSEDSKLNALTLGVDDYLTKPFSPEELLARAHNLLLRHEVRVEARQEARQEAGKLKLEESQNGDLEGVSLWESDDESNDITAHQNDTEWLEQVTKVIRKELENPHFQMADLASQFNLSIRHFYRRIKTTTGMSPKKYQQEVALLKARNLLEKGSFGNVTAICYSIGMSNVSRFSQLYEARFGKKPKAYFGG